MKVEIDADELCELRMGSFGTAMAEKTLADIARRDRDDAYKERDFWREKCEYMCRLYDDLAREVLEIIDPSDPPMEYVCRDWSIEADSLGLNK